MQLLCPRVSHWHRTFRCRCHVMCLVDSNVADGTLSLQALPSTLTCPHAQSLDLFHFRLCWLLDILIWPDLMVFHPLAREYAFNLQYIPNSISTCNDQPVRTPSCVPEKPTAVGRQDHVFSEVITHDMTDSFININVDVCNVNTANPARLWIPLTPQ